MNELLLKHSEVDDILRQIISAVHKLKTEYFVRLEDIYISVPYNLQTVIGFLMPNHRPGDRPKTIYGCNVIPAHENKITVFFDEWQIADISPIHIELKTPVKV